MDSKKSSNNRAHERASLNVNVEVQSVPQSGALEGSKMVCLTRDISLTGMCIYTGMELPTGSNLLLDLELGNPVRHFNLLGKVIWSAPDSDVGRFKTGIHLTKLPGDTGAWHAAVLDRLVG
jgi:Tfp pilus assembly protein PilZ